MNLLITGASGYIGSQACKILKKNSFFINALDRNEIKHSYYDQKLIMDYSDQKLKKILENTDCVIHLAGSNLVNPSIKNPYDYYLNNISSTLTLLKGCIEANVKKFIFASSASVYGNSHTGICNEEQLCNPITPYGWSKYMVEIILKDFFKAYEFGSISLRFFNVAGADSEKEFGPKKASTHIISRILEKSFLKEVFILNGDQYETKDGSCVRDYVHVQDIGNGLINAIDFLNANKGAYVFNLGNGSGFSNIEIINAIKENTPLNPIIKVGSSIKGDVPKLIAEVSKAKSFLKWETKHNLKDIVTSSYNWTKNFY